MSKNLAATDSKSLQLHDGRTLGYVEYGNPDGTPLFYFHGHPGSRFEAGFLAEQAKKHGTRLIGVDRPGLGLSTYKAGRQLLAWPDDVAELADSLRLSHFAVVGFSGGSLYALSCAYKLSDRLTACGLISGVGQTGRFLSFLATWMPYVIFPLTKRLFSDEARAKKTLARVARTWVEPDRKAVSLTGISEIMAKSLAESFHQGMRGAAYDGMLIAKRNCGFTLEDVSFPQMYLWHGTLDKEVPIAQARNVAQKLQHCRATFYPNEGHISTIVNHQEEIVEALTLE
jgi:pimeloyl-ACP methyl ester carboxylesterase